MKLNTKYTKPPEDHHSSDVVCWRRGDTQSWINPIMIMMIDDDYKHKQITVTLSVTWWSVKLDLHKKTSSALDRRWSVITDNEQALYSPTQCWCAI